MVPEAGRGAVGVGGEVHVQSGRGGGERLRAEPAGLACVKALGIECSMSRVGDCYDNAVAERFFWSLEHEWTKHETLVDLEAARLSVFKYVETF
jgi:transposase InsO family protein